MALPFYLTFCVLLNHVIAKQGLISHLCTNAQVSVCHVFVFGLQVCSFSAIVVTYYSLKVSVRLTVRLRLRLRIGLGIGVDLGLVVRLGFGLGIGVWLGIGVGLGLGVQLRTGLGPD